MKRLLLSVCLVAVPLTACGPRPVTVTTGAQPASEVSLRVTNNLSQAINVYIRSGTADIFVKQIAANTVEWVPIEGLRPGMTVTLLARPVSGTPTYTQSVVLQQSMEWRVP